MSGLPVDWLEVRPFSATSWAEFAAQLAQGSKVEGNSVAPDRRAVIRDVARVLYRHNKQLHHVTALVLARALDNAGLLK